MEKTKADLERPNVKAVVDGYFETHGQEIKKKFADLFFLLPNGEPSYRTILLVKRLKARGVL